MSRVLNLAMEFLGFVVEKLGLIIIPLLIWMDCPENGCFLYLFTGWALFLTGVRLLRGLAYLGYIRFGKTLAVQKAGDMGEKPDRLLAFLINAVFEGVISAALSTAETIFSILKVVVQQGRAARQTPHRTIALPMPAAGRELLRAGRLMALARPLALLITVVVDGAITAAFFALAVILILPWIFPLNPPRLPSGPDLVVLGRVEAGWTLESLDGKEVPFRGFQGRAVFVNIWATWCPPCIAEMPGIEKLYDALKEQEVAVVLVTTEQPERVRRFVKRKGWHVPVYVARYALPAIFETNAIPATFIVNRRGEVVYQHTGIADWNTEDCRSFLRRLQAE
jgi:thiol-disulfide isomerase/thioredoxin